MGITTDFDDSALVKAFFRLQYCSPTSLLVHENNHNRVWQYFQTITDNNKSKTEMTASVQGNKSKGTQEVKMNAI